ncbi:nitrate- and nitrite sensing domain-containing protein [Streptomyces sp. NPDC002537]
MVLLPQDWKISTRMAIALLLPIALALALAVSEIRGALERAEQMRTGEESTKTVIAAVQLAHALENERDFAALTGKSKVDMTPYREETDRLLAEYQGLGTVGLMNQGMVQRVADTQKGLQGLAELRVKAYTKNFDSVATDLAYANMITPLLSLPMEVARNGGSNAADIWALSSLSIGKASISSQRALLNAGFSRGQVKKTEQKEAASHGWLQKVTFREFRTAAQKQDVEKFKEALDASYISAMVGRAGAINPLEIDENIVKDWNTSATRIIDDLHEIEKQIALRVADTAAHERYTAQRTAWWNGGLVAFALLLTFLLAVWIVQATVRQLSRLRRTSLRAARQELPALVTAVADGRAAKEELRPVPLDLGTRDEIGDVSRAFEQVFGEAVKQTAEQAELRASVNAMLASMARRNQGLVYRQLEVITGMESEETDPVVLEKLFRVDHLATRMRRHGENLLVLAGERPGRVHQEPAPLVDIIRAAASEVEQFTRIEVVTSADVWVKAQVVHDLTHLLAELMDNATQYSAPSTQVAVTSRSTLSGDVLIEVEDSGVGIAEATVERLNKSLTRTMAVDASATRQMGLYVVSRLASVHGVKVRLGSMGRGTTASVVLPSSCVAVSRPMPDLAPVPAPALAPVPAPAPKPVPVWSQQAPAAEPEPRPWPSDEPREEPQDEPEAPGPLPPEAPPAPGLGGLPRRTPLATLRERNAPVPPQPEEEPGRDAAELRRRLSGFYTGANRARQDHDGKEDRADD